MLWFWRLGSFVHVVVGGVWTPSKIVSPDTMSLIGEVVSVLVSSSSFLEAAAKSVLDVILAVVTTTSLGGWSTARRVLPR